VLADFLLRTPFVKEVVFQYVPRNRCLRRRSADDILSCVVPKISHGSSRTSCLSISRKYIDLNEFSTPTDRLIKAILRWAIDSLADETFFSQHTKDLKPEDLKTLSALSARWNDHVSAGRFKLSVPLDTPIGGDTEFGNFWTTQYPYALMPEKDPELLTELKQSGLVIFKGDLNYRK
jgi:hypothetical protein